MAFPWVLCIVSPSSGLPWGHFCQSVSPLNRLSFPVSVHVFIMLGWKLGIWTLPRDSLASRFGVTGHWGLQPSFSHLAVSEKALFLAAHGQEVSVLFFFFFSGQPCADRDFLKETFFLKQPLGSSELSPPRGMSALPIYGCFRMFSDHQLLLMPTGLHVFLNNPYLVYFAESLRVKEDPVLKQNTKELPIPLMPFICCLSH